MNASMAFLNGKSKTQLPKRKGNPSSKSATRPRAFKNDPDDPQNPNKARVRFLKQIDKQHNR